jgi:hypothetical protein
MVVGNVVIGATISTATESKEALERRLAGVASDVRFALDPDRAAEDRAPRIEDLRLRAEYWLDEGRPSTTPDRQCLHWPLEFPEIFVDRDRPGFDAVVGNPPFKGGKRISGPFGTTYREHLVKAIADGRTGNADLVTYFFLRGAQIVRQGGSIALLSTNTIAQGDTREVGLDWLTANSWSIPRAVKSRPWPGDASLEIAQVWLHQGPWGGSATLDNEPVQTITTTLESSSRAQGQPHRLAANSKRSFIGSLLNGIGFVLEPAEAIELLERDSRNADVLFPYLNGEDLNSRPDCSASRWVINFFDWTLDHAEEYPSCLEIINSRVKPIRERLKNKPKESKNYWLFERRAVDLYTAIKGMQRVLVIAQTSKTLQPVFVSNNQVFSHMIVVLSYGDTAHFSLLSSAFHYWWTISHSATIRTDIRYIPTDCFETFPQPVLSDALDVTGAALDTHRRQLMLNHREGLTATYNRVHYPKEDVADIAELRRLHVELDYAVADAYGWNDLVLDHDFWETRQGMRFTIGPEARVEVLDRLLELNHACYNEEIRMGPHTKTSAAPRTRGRRTTIAEVVDAMFEVEGEP